MRNFHDLLKEDPLTDIGGKATSLIELIRTGSNVPDGIVLGFEAFESVIGEDLWKSYLQILDNADIKGAKELRTKIMQSSMTPDLADDVDRFIEQNPGRGFAVRSSGSREDLEGASFAGLYQTVLNAKTISDIVTAIKRCWASLLDERVWEYCAQQKIPLNTLQMAVIVQVMVEAEKSGVAFSVNPVTGNDREVLIEACFGLGEALVSGVVTPDQYQYNWIHELETGRSIAQKETALFAIDTPPYVVQQDIGSKSSKPVLSENEVATLSRLIIDIQVAFGYPVDVEWVWHQGEFYIVQARPITSINFSGISGEWSTADFKDGGVSSSVCTPYMWSLYDYIWENSLPAFLIKIKLLPKTDCGGKWGDMFYSRPYWSLDRVKHAYAKLPGYVERNFDEDVGIEVCYQGQGVVTPLNLKSALIGGQSMWCFSQSLKKHLAKLPGFKKSQSKRLQELAAIDLDALSTSERKTFFRDFIEKEYFHSESCYFEHIFHTSIAMSLFKDFYRKTKSPVIFIDLVSGLQNVSHLKLNKTIWDLSRDLREDTESRAYWVKNSVETLLSHWKQSRTDYGIDHAADLIRDFKYHSMRELDIRVPRFGEDPRFLLKSIKENIELSDQFNPHNLNDEQHDQYQSSVQLFYEHLPVFYRAKGKRLLARLRHILWWREELRDLSTQYYYHVRRITLSLSEYLIKQQIISTPDDMFFLTKDDLIGVINKKLSSSDARMRMSTNKTYYMSFRNFENPNEIGCRFTEMARTKASDTHAITGIACSPGIVEGRARVISDIYDADRLEEGDILITRYTDPGWTPKFSLITAVATETGGVLSHAAVIAREYGIPAVLAVQNLTSMITDGDFIRIDGAAGSIELIGKGN